MGFASCPDCGEVWSAKGMGAHRRHRHGYSPGGQRPDRVYVYGLTGPFVCPECGSETTTAAGLGAHRWKSHGKLGDSHAARLRLRQALDAGVVLDRDQARQVAERAAATFTALVARAETTLVVAGVSLAGECARRAPVPVRSGAVTVWVGRCACGRQVLGPRRYEVLDALLAEHQRG